MSNQSRAGDFMAVAILFMVFFIIIPALLSDFDKEPVEEAPQEPLTEGIVVDKTIRYFLIASDGKQLGPIEVDEDAYRATQIGDRFIQGKDSSNRNTQPDGNK